MYLTLLLIFHWRVGKPKPASKKLGKSSWKGRGDQTVNVETRALEHYEDLGFKGFVWNSSSLNSRPKIVFPRFHCETKILTTLFALLFWDILFANISGALETPFQDAPLDLCEDTFYYARKDLIEARLAEIRDGKAPEILLRHDEQYREKDTWCVGLSWELCEREDLLDIVKVYSLAFKYESENWFTSSALVESPCQRFASYFAKIIKEGGVVVPTFLSGRRNRNYANLWKSKDQATLLKKTRNFGLMPF